MSKSASTKMKQEIAANLALVDTQATPESRIETILKQAADLKRQAKLIEESYKPLIAELETLMAIGEKRKVDEFTVSHEGGRKNLGWACTAEEKDKIQMSLIAEGKMQVSYTKSSIVFR